MLVRTAPSHRGARTPRRGAVLAALGVAALLASAVPAGAAPVALAPPAPALDLLLDADGQYDGGQAGDQIGRSLDVASVTSAGSVDAIIGYLRGGALWARVVRGTPQGQLDLAQAVTGLSLTSTPSGVVVQTRSVGDVDDDGLDDVLHWGYPNQPARIFGGRAAQASTLDSSSPGVLSVRSPDRFLSSIRGVGDVDGDGLDDLATLTRGSAGRHRVDVVRSVAGRTALDVGAPDAIGFQVTLRNAASGVEPAGDMNGDGRDDIVVMTSDRRLVVVYGSTTTLPIAASALGQAGFEIVAEDDGGSYGPFFDAVVAPAGDVNRDGLDDLAIGTRVFVHGSTSGAAFVIYGRRGATGTVDISNLGTRGVRVDGPSGATSAYFGESIAAGADLVGGPAPDLVIGAPQSSEGGRAGQGAVYVVSVEGERGSFGVDDRGWTGYRIDGPTRDAEIGDRFANHEQRLAVGGPQGGTRLLIGVPSADPRNRRDAGSVFVVNGEPSARPLPLGDVAYVPYAAASRSAVRAPARAASLRLRARRAVRVRATLLRLVPGRRIGGRCVAGTRPGAPICTALGGARTATRRVAAGKRIAIPLAAAARRLPKGTYLLRVRATDATGRTFGPWRLRFRVR